MGPATPSGLLWVSARPVVRGQTLVGASLSGTLLGSEAFAEWDRALGVQLFLRAEDGAVAGAGQPPSPLPPQRGLHVVKRANRRVAIWTVPLTGLGERAPPTAFLVVDLVDLPGVSERTLAVGRWALLLASLFGALGMAYRGGRLGRHR